MNYKISPEKLIKIRENKSKIQRNGTCFLTFLLLFTLLIICLIAPISRIAYTANCFAIIGMLLLIPLYHSSHKSELVISSESVLFRQALIITSVEMSINTMLSVLEGKKETRVLGDGWTVKSRDGKLTCHYENTVVVTKDGCKVLSENMIKSVEDIENFFAENNVF